MIVGSRVKIKSFPTIEGTLTSSNERDVAGYHHKHGDLGFAEEMKNFCFLDTRISWIWTIYDGYTLYTLEGCGNWLWHEDWVYDMTYKNILSDDLFTI